MSSQELNQDIIMEVLSRSTYETTIRCSRLCKGVQRLTQESHFKRLHSRRTNTIRGVFLQSVIPIFVSTGSNKNPESNLSLDFLPYINSKILACDPNTGIMLCFRSRPGCCGEPLYIVCKPSTKQWCSIQGPEIRPSTQAVGFSVLTTKPFRFKIVRVSLRSPQKGCVQGRCFCFRWEVFDSGVWLWKTLHYPCLPDRTHRTFLPSCPAVSYCGRLHWLTDDGSVVSFCAKTESSDMFSQPKEVPRRSQRGILDTRVKLVKYKGKLGLIHWSDNWSCIDLRVLEDDWKEMWVLKHKLDVGCTIGKNRCSLYDVVWPIVFWISDVAPFKLLMYDVEKEEMEGAGMCDSRIDSIFSLCSDMEKVCELMDRAAHRSMYRNLTRISA